MRIAKIFLPLMTFFLPLCLSSCKTFISDDDTLIEQESKNIYLKAVDGGYFKNYDTWKKELIGLDNINKGLTIKSYQKVDESNLEYKYNVFFSDDTKKELYICKNYYGLTGYELYKSLNPTYLSTEGEWGEDLINNKLNDKSIYRVSIMNEWDNVKAYEPDISYYKYGETIDLGFHDNYFDYGSSNDYFIGSFDQNNQKLPQILKITQSISITNKYDLRINSINLLNREYLERPHRVAEPIYLDCYIDSPFMHHDLIDFRDSLSFYCNDDYQYIQFDRTSDRAFVRFNNAGTVNFKICYWSYFFNEKIETSFTTTIIDDLPNANFYNRSEIDKYSKANIPSSGSIDNTLIRFSGYLSGHDKNNTYFISNNNDMSLLCRFNAPIEGINDKDLLGRAIVAYGYLKNNQGNIELLVIEYYFEANNRESLYDNEITSYELKQMKDDANSNKDTLVTYANTSVYGFLNTVYQGNGIFIFYDKINQSPSENYYINISTSSNNVLHYFDDMEIGNRFLLFGNLTSYNTLINQFDYVVNDFEFCEVKDQPTSINVTTSKNTYLVGEVIDFIVTASPNASYNRITSFTCYGADYEKVDINKIKINSIGEYDITCNILNISTTLTIRIIPKKSEIISIDDYYNYSPKQAFVYGYLDYDITSRGTFCSLTDGDVGITFRNNQIQAKISKGSKAVAQIAKTPNSYDNFKYSVVSYDDINPTLAESVIVEKNENINNRNIKYYLGRDVICTARVESFSTENIVLTFGTSHALLLFVPKESVSNLDLSVDEYIQFKGVFYRQDVNSARIDVCNFEYISCVKENNKIILNADNLKLIEQNFRGETITFGDIEITYENLKSKNGNINFYCTGNDNSFVSPSLYVSKNDSVEIKDVSFTYKSSEDFIIWYELSQSLEYDRHYEHYFDMAENENFHMYDSYTQKPKGFYIGYQSDYGPIDLEIKNITIYY